MDESARSQELAGDWPMIESQFPPNWRELAARHGVSPKKQQAHLGTKVKDVEVPLRMVLHHVGTNTSLKTTAAIAAAAGLVNMSAVALHLWMRRFAPFLTALLAELTNTARDFAAARWAAYEMMIVDASIVSRPGSKGTTMRVHYALRLTDLKIVQVDVTDEKGGETFKRFVPTVKRGQLWIADRGYANPPGVAAIIKKGADVLVRHNRGSLPLYDIYGSLLDVREKLSRLRLGVPREWAACVHPQGQAPIRGRMCAVRLPPDKTEEARGRLKREYGAALTAESCAMAEFVVLFTTVPRARLMTNQIMELYGLRWQVELSIKRDKSIAGLDRLPNFRDDTIRAWILAKLLLTQVARKIATPEMVAFPPCAA
jgi:Transposase DDE domain